MKKTGIGKSELLVEMQNGSATLNTIWHPSKQQNSYHIT